MHESFQYPKFLEALNSIPRKFPVLRDKKVRKKTGQPPSLIHNFFSTPEKFWNTEGNSYEAFWTCETKDVRQN